MKLDPTCLSCQHSSHDTSSMLSLFKLACLAYTLSPVHYREKLLSRMELVRMRRRLGEKIAEVTGRAKVFREQALVGKRWFDDVVIEHKIGKHKEGDTISYIGSRN